MPKARLTLMPLIVAEGGLHSYLRGLQSLNGLNVSNVELLLRHLLYFDENPFDSRTGDFVPREPATRNALIEAIVSTLDYEKLIKSPEVLQIAEVVTGVVLGQIGDCGKEGCPAPIPTAPAFYASLGVQIEGSTYPISPLSND